MQQDEVKDRVLFVAPPTASPDEEKAEKTPSASVLFLATPRGEDGEEKVEPHLPALEPRSDVTITWADLAFVVILGAFGFTYIAVGASERACAHDTKSGIPFSVWLSVSGATLCIFSILLARSMRLKATPRSDHLKLSEVLFGTCYMSCCLFCFYVPWSIVGYVDLFASVLPQCGSQSVSFVLGILHFAIPASVTIVFGALFSYFLVHQWTEDMYD